MVTIFLADKHKLIREGIKSLLQKVPKLDVVGEAQTPEQTLEGIRKLKPDILLLDIYMPSIGSLEIIRRTERIHKKLKCIVIDSNANSTFAPRYIKRGVAGCILKTSNSDELIKAITEVSQGKNYITPDIAQAVALKQLNPTLNHSLDSLSDRELQIAAMIAQGLNVEKIASKLCLGVKTIHTHRYHIFAKLQVENDVQLTHLAVKHELVDMVIGSHNLHSLRSDP